MNEEIESPGMSDEQYCDHLRSVIADLERIKGLGVSEDAAQEIESIVTRYRKTIEG